MGTDSLIFDQNAALERVDQDKELLLELCQMFFSEHEASLRSLQAALLSKDAGAAREVAHSMKSALGNLGAMQAYGIAQRIEMKCKEGDAAGALESQDEFVRALREFRRVIEAGF